jgi:hypothetical protein
MWNQLELVGKYAPAAAAISLVLGGAYNIGVIAGAEQLDLLYLLTYLDHVNSAVMSTGLFLILVFVLVAVGSLFAPAAARLAARLRLDRFKIRLSTRAIGLVVVAFAIACSIAFRLGLPRFMTGADFMELFLLTAGILLVRFVRHTDREAAVLAGLFVLMATFGFGSTWVGQVRKNTGPLFYIEAGGPIVAKGIKAFSQFAILVDDHDQIVVLRSADIKRMTLARDAPEGFGSAKPPEKTN